MLLTIPVCLNAVIDRNVRDRVDVGIDIASDAVLFLYDYDCFALSLQLNCGKYPGLTTTDNRNIILDDIVAYIVGCIKDIRR